MSDVFALIKSAEGKDAHTSLKILKKALQKAEKAKNTHLMAVCLLKLARPYKELGKHKKELECLFQVEKIADILPKIGKTGALLSNLATKYRELGKYKKSLQLLEKALPLFKNPEKAAIYNNMGNCYYELNNYQEAIKFYTKAKDIFDPNYPHKHGICLQNIGNSLREMNKFTEALKYYQKAYDLFFKYECYTECAHVLWNKAIVHDELEEFNTALNCYDTALDIVENPYDTAKILNDKALTLRKLTKYKEALHLLQKALPIFEQSNMPVETTEIKRNIAGLKRNLNQYEEALHDLYEAREHMEKLQKPDSVADIEWEIANVYISADHPQLAIWYYDRVLNYYAKTGKAIFAAKAKRDKAAVLKDLGEYNEALGLYYEAEDLFKQHGLSVELASTLVNRGNLYRILHKNDDALTLFERAHTLYCDAGIKVHAAAAEFNRAATLASLSQYEKALSLFKKVEKIFLQCGQVISVAETRMNEAVLLGELGNYQEAFSTLQSAKSLLTDRLVGHHLSVDLNQGALLAETGQYQEALEILYNVSEKAVQHNMLIKAYKAYWALGHIYKEKNKLKKAYHYLRKSLHFSEKIREDISPSILRMSFFSEIEDIYQEMVFLTHRMGMKHTSFSVLQKMKARTLIEEITAAEKLICDIPHKIAKLYSELHKAPVTYEEAHHLFDTIKTLQTEYTDSVIKKELSPKDVQIQFPQVRNIQDQIPHNAAFIEYMIKEDDLLIFLVTAHSFKIIPVLVQNLKNYVYEYLLRIRTRKSLKSLSHTLYQLLMEPVYCYLENIHVLHVIPHDILYHFPFHSLHQSKKTVLAQKYPVVYHPAGTLLKDHVCSQRNVLVIGNPGKNLKRVEEECKTIFALSENSGRDTTLLLNEDATKKNFYELYSDYDIIHVACHGVYDSFNPLQSGLKLYDGVLTALEMHYLNLQGKVFTLGACGSGSVAVEKGSELMGITRALVCAGGWAIASLWETPDISSELFWKKLYAHVLDGKNLFCSFQNAQKFLISTEFSHPYYWAGYRIIG
jgi:tetratricopeptide (TPR) repeat protein